MQALWWITINLCVESCVGWVSEWVVKSRRTDSFLLYISLVFFIFLRWRENFLLLRILHLKKTERHVPTQVTTDALQSILVGSLATKVTFNSWSHVRQSSSFWKASCVVRCATLILGRYLSTIRTNEKIKWLKLKISNGN